MFLHLKKKKKKLVREVTLLSYNLPICGVTVFEANFLFRRQFLMNYWNNQIDFFSVYRKKATFLRK